MHRIVAFTLFLAAAGRSLAGQMPYGNGAGAGRNQGADAPRMTPSVAALPSPEDLAGPGLPEFVVDRFELDTTEAKAYRAAYDSFMTATRGLRDSALASRHRIDALWQSGDRGAARAQFPILHALGDLLAKEDGRFDDRVVKKVFSKEHFKEYKDWRSDQRRQADADRNERMKQMSGASNQGP
jgi:hypothetical protein